MTVTTLDRAALDRDRRQRVFAAMAARDLDALVLGRQDDADYACGMRRLWVAGTRPFGAGCVLVAATGRVHVLSSWDAGIPPSIPFEDLYPTTWNPAVMSESMASIEGLSSARRLGSDSSSIAFARAAARFAPSAELVPADDLMAEVRRTKSPEEIELVRAACAVAWTGVDAVLDAGAAAPDATAVAVAAMARAGSTIPSSAPEVRRDGDGWVVDLGVIVDHYEGGVGGRFVDGEREGPTTLVDACVAGATGAALAAVATTGDWWVRGVGMGYERPVIGSRLGHAEVLAPGMVLSVRDGLRRDVVAVTDDGPRLLSARP